MKKTITLSLLCIAAITATAGNIYNPQDTLFQYKGKTIAIKEVGDSLSVNILPASSGEPQSIQNEVQSSVSIDGSSFNFIFSWKNNKNLHPHWTGAGMAFLNYDGSNIPHSDLNLGSSRMFSLNLIDYSLRIQKSNWLFVSGIGFDWFRYHFNGNAAVEKVNGTAIFQPAPEGTTYRSSKLLVYYVTFPLLLEYQLPIQNKNIYISGGVVGFLKYYSKSQVNFYVGNRREVITKGTDLNIRPVDLKLRLQAGIGNIGVYGYYSPFSLFANDRGPDLQTYSIGVMLTF